MGTPRLTVYKASAGSGKTFTLATEYIKLLISNPGCYRNILAVTFTNKATEEMKSRILSQLYGIWKLLPDSENYINTVTDSLQISREYASKQAGTALSNLIHNYNYFRVETIDTFFQSVLRNLARELDLTANLKIGLNDYQVEEQAVDLIIQELDTTSAMLNWIISYITSNIDEDKSWNVIGQIKSFGKTIFRDYYKAKSSEIDKKLTEKDFFEQYTKTIKKIRHDSKKCMEQYAATFFETIEEAGLDSDSFSGKSKGICSYFKKIQSDNFSDKACLNKTLSKHLDNADNWVAKTSKNRETTLMIVENSLLDLLRNAENVRSKMWKRFVSADVTLKHLNKLRLLSSIEKRVRLINEETNTFLLSDTQQLLDVLTEGTDSPFIFEKIGTQLEHVMIDEFQDTSTIQWHNFKKLLDEIMSHADTSSLIVGDVKQSIYRWRSGDWRLLNSINKQFEFPEEQLRIKTLQTNYRSETGIIEFNNKFFELAAKAEYINEAGINPEGAEELKLAYSDVRQLAPESKSSDGMVRIKLLTNEDYTDSTLDEIGRTVDELIYAGMPLDSIAILVRTNKYIPMIADYFMHTRPEISIVSDEAFRLDASLAVCTIINALRLLIAPDDILTRANLSKAYSRINGKVWNNMPAGYMELPEEYTANTDRLLDMPLMDLADKLYCIFNIEKLAEQSAYICAFYDQLSSFAAENSTDIEAFLKEWNESIYKKTIQSDEVDGIRIISIHKSKGLEFDNVIIPFCDWVIEMRQGNILWCEAQSQPYNDLPLIPVDYSGKLAETVYSAPYIDEHLQNCVDNLNLLYVAFTRASKNLFVTGRLNLSNSRSLLIQQILPELCSLLPEATLYEAENMPTVFEYGQLALSGKTAGKEKNTSSNVFLDSVKPLKLQIETFATPVGFRQSNKSRDFIKGNADDDEQKQYIKMGNIMHNLFSRIRTTEDIPHILKELECDGMLYDENISAERIQAMLKQRLGDKRVQEWFSPKWHLFNECSIITVNSEGELQERRPDRVMTDGERMIVVDFKFGRQRDEYKEQVLEYMRLLSDMGYKNIQGYLWYVYSNKIEEVKQ